MAIENKVGVEPGPLPPMPEWAKSDDLGGLLPSQVREALTAHARAAWNMGLNYCLTHAPAETATALPELRDLLARAVQSGQAINLSPASAGALHMAMTTPPADAMLGDELQQLKAQAQEKAADGANWTMEVGCMFVLAMIERIEASAAQQAAGAVVQPFLAVPEGWQVVPKEPTPEIIAGAAIAVWPTASAADIALARLAAPIVLMHVDAPGVTVDSLAGMLATMAPAYRAMLAAAPSAGAPP